MDDMLANSSSTGLKARNKISETEFVSTPLHDNPGKLLTLTEFGSNSTACDYEIWRDGRHNSTQEVGACAAALITKELLEGIIDVRMSGVDQCTSSTPAELYGLNSTLDWAQNQALGKSAVIFCDNMVALDWITGNSQRQTYSWIKAKLKCLLMAVQGLVTLTFVHVPAHTGWIDWNEQSSRENLPPSMDAAYAAAYGQDACNVLPESIQRVHRSDPILPPAEVP